ncbi:prephenate dehydrogenase [Brachybacterium sp. DNPG3]
MSTDGLSAPSATSAADSGLPCTVRIIGVGLIGGSLGLALTAAGVDVQLQDVSPGTTALAVELGVGSIAGEGAAAPELVVVAAPPDVAAELVAQALRAHPQAIVADVASVKRTVLEGLRLRRDQGVLSDDDLARYVGAHPMAGREVSGVIAAQADLFLGRPLVVCPHATSRPRGAAMLKRIAVELGALPVVMDAERHDTAVAHVSHAPQVMASLLATQLLDADEGALELAGQGLRDSTRIAASDPRLWVEILSANAAALLPVLRGLSDRLDEVTEAVAALTGDPAPERGSRRAVASLIADGNRGVGRIPGKHGRGTDAFVTLTVLVPDRPGELARLLTEIGEIGVNLEDLHLEHSLGQPVGLAHIAIDGTHEALLTGELRVRGWTVAEA